LIGTGYFTVYCYFLIINVGFAGFSDIERNAVDNTLLSISVNTDIKSK
jgi:hypothetical protein